jgi:hypothetical protein
VIARVALNCALGTISSPGIAAATSLFEAPQRMCHGRTNGVAAHIGTADNVSAIKASLVRVAAYFYASRAHATSVSQGCSIPRRLKP